MIEVFKWQHKETKQKVRVMPWYEVVDETLFNEKELPLPEFKDRKYKIGALVQIGWLLENKNGVWLGVGPKAKDSFKDLGLWKEKKRKKK